jgi:hypothetical protein
MSAVRRQHSGGNIRGIDRVYVAARLYVSQNNDLGVLGDCASKKIAVIIHRTIISGRCHKEKAAHHSCMGARDFRVAAHELPVVRAGLHA